MESIGAFCWYRISQVSNTLEEKDDIIVRSGKKEGQERQERQERQEEQEEQEL